MDKAAHKYQNLVDSGTWKAPSESERKLLALTTKIKELTNKSGKRRKGKETKMIKREEDLEKGKGTNQREKTGKRINGKLRTQKISNPKRLKVRSIIGAL